MAKLRAWPGPCLCGLVRSLIGVGLFWAIPATTAGVSSVEASSATKISTSTSGSKRLAELSRLDKHSAIKRARFRTGIIIEREDKFLSIHIQPPTGSQ